MGNCMVSLPVDPRVSSLIPDTQVVGDRLHVPHNPYTHRILKNLDIELPSPVTVHYDWCGGKPFDIQRRTAELLTENPRAYVLSSFGTGKTKSVLWSYDYLRSTGIAKRMLVVAPLSTLRFVWAREAFMTTPHLKVNVLHGSREKRLKLLDDLADIYVINPDGFHIVLDQLIKRTDINVVSIDELAMFRNSSKRTKAMRRLCDTKPIVWGLTGAPTPNAPTDVYYQCKIVTPDQIKMPYSRFREELMVKITDYKWLPRPNATAHAYAVLQPNVRFTLDDVTELPDFVSQFVDVDLSPDQAKVYDDIRKHCFGLIKSHEITAVNAAAAMIKLLQISMGWVYGTGRETIDLDPSRRLSALVDLVDANDHKVLCYVPFKHALAGVCDALIKAGIDAVAVSGDTPSSQRAETFNTFQNTDRYKVLVAHPQVVAHGLTLTTADTVVWFGPITSAEIYDQANARIRRVGQRHKQAFVHMQATAIERKVYKLLVDKIDAQDSLLQLLEEASAE